LVDASSDSVHKIEKRLNLSYFGRKNHEKRTMMKLRGKKTPKKCLKIRIHDKKILALSCGFPT
jgi:hypothetical protein